MLGEQRTTLGGSGSLFEQKGKDIISLICINKVKEWTGGRKLMDEVKGE